MLFEGQLDNTFWCHSCPICLSNSSRDKGPLQWPLHSNQPQAHASCKGSAACTEVMGWLCPIHTQNTLPSWCTASLQDTPAAKDPQQLDSQKAAQYSTYTGSHISCTNSLQLIFVLYCRSVPELKFKIKNREPKPPPYFPNTYIPSYTRRATGSCWQWSVSKEMGSELHCWCTRGATN